MTAVSTHNQLVRFDDTIPETSLVAILLQEPLEFTERTSLEFSEGYDDLDYLVFAVLSLPSDSHVALVRHKHSPSPGTEIYVVPEELDVVGKLIETIQFLNLSDQDFSWIHPQYEEEFRQKIASLPIFSDAI